MFKDVKENEISPTEKNVWAKVRLKESSIGNTVEPVKPYQLITNFNIDKYDPYEKEYDKIQSEATNEMSPHPKTTEVEEKFPEEFLEKIKVEDFEEKPLPVKKKRGRPKKQI